MPEISVIMPSYNVARYIGESIESVIQQSFGDIEIIIVDAFSTDGTLEIAKTYADSDARIQLLTTEVKSYGAQLNLGIRRAGGRYIAIVETDDVAEPAMLELLYQKAVQYDLDYVKGDFNLFVSFEKEGQWKKKVPIFYGEQNDYFQVIDPRQKQELYLRDVYLWRGIYKRDFLEKNKIFFNETRGAAFQDVGFAFQVLGLAERGMYIDTVVYNYRQNNSGSSIFKPHGFYFLAEEYPFVMRQCMQKKVYNKVFETYYYTRMFHQIMARYRTMAASGALWQGTEQARRLLYNTVKSAYETGCFEEAVLGRNGWFELMQYLSSEEGYWQYQLSLYNTKRYYLEELLARVKEAKRIVLYSRSYLAGFVHCLIKMSGIAVDLCYCDNDEAKQGTCYMGTHIVSVEEAAGENPDALYIIANNHYSVAMKQQLLQLGIEKQRIHVCMLDMDILFFYMINGEKVSVEDKGLKGV